MGKTRKQKSKISDGGKTQHTSSLPESILNPLSSKDNTKRKKTKVTFEDNDDGTVDDKLTKKILQSALSQQEQLEESVGVQDPPVIVTKLKTSGHSDSDSDEEWPALGSEKHEGSNKFYQKFEEEIKIDKDDETALRAFMNPNPPAKRTLADIIMEKIEGKKADVTSMLPDNEKFAAKIDPRIRSVYREVKVVLKSYRSGKLPKAFKVIPHLKNWEEILYITEPEQWSAAAVYQATRIFTSNMNVPMAQRFFNLVLLPRVRDDIQYYKRLNFHLFAALKKTLFKPAAFFKGILLPLCEEGTCTLREATILGSVIAKFSIPVLHSSAALLKIAEMNYSGANSIFLRILIAKKYALPFRVIDALVYHFLSFRNEKRPLPVLWHQSLLTFVEIYRGDIASEQKEELLALLRIRRHEKITPVIRRQLQTAECRDIEMDEPMPCS